MKSFEVVLKSKKRLGNHITSWGIIEKLRTSYEIIGSYVEIIEKLKKS